VPLDLFTGGRSVRVAEMAAEPKRRAPGPKPGPSSEQLLLARFLADLLDQRFNIPGTSIRIGLDPIIGLIPGVGDAIANLAGSAILVIAARIGVPKVVLLRMGLNIATNAALGSVPILGDVFSIWFKSNARNAQLLERYAGGGQSSTKKDWALVAAIIIGAVLILVGSLVAIVFLARQFWAAF
jgi:hypothetical protein